MPLIVIRDIVLTGVFALELKKDGYRVPFRVFGKINDLREQPCVFLPIHGKRRREEGEVMDTGVKTYTRDLP